MQHDITLRSLAGLSTPTLIRLIAGCDILAMLPTEFPSARDRRVDTLVALTDHRILHLEWQTGYDPSMPYRMLGYWLLIALAYPDRVIEQVVIQVGGRKPVAPGLETATLSFRYRVIDSRDIDPVPLLESGAINDAILAILFGTDDLTLKVRAILRRIAQLDAPARRDAVTQLLILAGLRGAVGLVLEEAKVMPLQITYENDPYLTELVRKGRIEGESIGEARGEALALIRLIEKRFGPLPASRRDLIKTAGPKAVEAWLDRFVDASSPDAIFAETPMN